MEHMKILIADDDVELSKTVAMRLQAAGYEVVFAEEADQGTIVAHKERPDLILLDIKMPAGGGLAMLENLRKSPETKQIPVILFSALNPTEVIKKVDELRLADYILKPFSTKELLTKIKNAL